VLDALPPAGATDRGYRLGSPLAYGVCVVVTVFAILSQYFLPEAIPALQPIYGNFFGDLFVVYGVPILAFAALVGARPIAGFVENTGTAVVQGLAWYGVLSLVAIVVTIALTIAYLVVDPAALKLLNNTTPVIQAASGDPWFWVVFSFVIGLVEELIFRGWIFGYWLRKDPGRWLWHAGWTSALFAGVHLYYGQTYGAAAPLIFPSLFLLGFAFAATMRASGGNILIVGILHGANDAIAFYSLISNDQALAWHYGIVLIGAAVALSLYLWRRPSPPPAPASPGPFGGAPPPYRPANPYSVFPPARPYDASPEAPLPPPPPVLPPPPPPAAP
jgi:membrane protease YdiL (CAAX protease family)